MKSSKLRSRDLELVKIKITICVTRNKQNIQNYLSYFVYIFKGKECKLVKLDINVTYNQEEEKNETKNRKNWLARQKKKLFFCDNCIKIWRMKETLTVRRGNGTSNQKRRY